MKAVLEFSNLVEKQRTAVCLRDKSLLVRGRASERAFDVAKQLAFDEVGRNARTVDVDEWGVGTG